MTTGPVDALAVLEARGITKVFPGARALDDVSMVVRAGVVHALVGENGAGKSTLIKVLTGVYPPDGGHLLHHQQEVSFANPRAAQDAGISTIYQEVNLVPQQNAARNIYLGREPRTRLGLIDFGRMHRDATAVLQGLSIDVDVRAPIGSLGLGAQQMVSVARAVSLSAGVVIMDEPTSSLEAREVETLFRLIERLRSAGTAIIYVSHRLEELYRMCEDVTVLRDGRVVRSGRLADLPRTELVAAMLGRQLLDEKARQHAAPGQEVAGSPPTLSARGLSRRSVLHDVDVDVRSGEVVGLGGLLGAGRSETVKAILGGQPIDHGTVQVSGKPIRTGSPAAAIRAGIALLPEDRKLEGILPHLSVRDNIVLAALPGLSRAGVVSDRAADAVVDRYMKALSIKAYGPGQKVGTLSGGNQQKVLLARWLCLHPKVLMLDEPTRGIDVGAKAEVRRLIDELAEGGLAVLLVSSDTEELVEGSHRIVVLREGSVVTELRGGQVTEKALVQAIAGTADQDPADSGD